MSLLDYEQRFSQLNPNRVGNHISPHKLAMMLAVFDLIETGDIQNNEIYFTEPLQNKFTKHFNSLKTEGDRDNPHLPFFHLRGEGFWHHQILPGHREAYQQLMTASGPGAIENHISYAYLDEELFELLGNQFARELLKTALYSNIEITQERRQAILDVGNGWDWLECEASVQDYFLMLFKQLKGEKYNKSQHRKSLMAKLNGRSEGAIEFKHQNISAILIELGQPYIPGYKPAANYQTQLKEAVFAHLAAREHDIKKLAEQGQLTTPKNVDWDSIIDTDIPDKLPVVAEPQRKYLARKLNFLQQESRNRKLGQRGEQFVVDFEKYRLCQAGREDLAKEVEWTSKTKGDGAGFDIQSFAWMNHQPIEKVHYIEVKTTNSGKYQPFLISENEVAFSKDFSDQYSLYRVFEFKQQPKLFQLPGSVEDHVHLLARSYRASFS